MKAKQSKDGTKKEQELEVFSNKITENRKRFEQLFYYPTNNALKFRELYISSINRHALILFVAGAVDTKMIDQQIIKPLLEPQSQSTVRNEINIVTDIMHNVLTTASGKKITKIKEAVENMLNGSTLILIDGQRDGILIDTNGFESRSVTEPTAETVVKGPKTAFIESAQVNRSLIRRQLKDHHLITEIVTVGTKSPQQVSVLYIQNIVDKELVSTVKKRIEEVQQDAILEISMLEEVIEERPSSLFPSCMTTERPDRACSFLLEGHVILLMDNSPVALVTPITFWSLFQTAEDQFLRMPYGNFSRIIRLIALFIGLLTPAFFLAVTTFHPEMIPTDLLLAMAGTRERIPFPTLWEIVLMEITFEILREAGIRVPTPLGATIGIVGALILGQAAVEANIVSPIMVIIVSITGLASFAIPDIGLSVIVRILRFCLLFAANFLGFIGIALALTAIMAYAASLKAFGVPFFSPLAPYTPSSKDLFLRPVLKKQWLRPQNMSPQRKIRAAPKGETKE
ncbi:spore germination protein [Bacillus sp. VT-16-64]|nr:spore germination protein [Bacillus sp. VT-16-64]